MSSFDVRAFSPLGACVLRRKLRVRIPTDRAFAGADTYSVEFVSCAMVVPAQTEISKSKSWEELFFSFILKGAGNKFHNYLHCQINLRKHCIIDIQLNRNKNNYSPCNYVCHTGLCLA